MFLMVSWDSVVIIATGYSVNCPGIISWWEQDFSTPIQTGPGANSASHTMGTRRGCEVAVALH